MPSNLVEISNLINTSQRGLEISQPLIFSDMGTIELVQMFITYAFIIVAGLSVVYIFLGGIQFILSAGDEEKIKKAVNGVRNSVIGLIIVLLSFTGISIIGNSFGFNFIGYVSFYQIRDSINQVIQSHIQSAPINSTQQQSTSSSNFFQK